MAVAGVEMDHALQNLFCGFERTTGTQTLSGRGEELPCFGFLSQPDVNLGQARSHGCILRIHFQNFLENTDRLLQFAAVRSLGSFLRIFSYSAMAFCSLPCWTNFSAALRTFCLLKPKPNAI